MVKYSALIASAAYAILAACATPGGMPGSDTRAQVAHVPAAPAFDWPGERQRIAAALAGSDEVAVLTRPDGSLQLTLPGAEGFERNGTEPRAAMRATLERIAAVLRGVPETDVLVIGHTDSIGSEMYNLALSIRRAEAVMEHLRVHGIALTRLSADGKGEAEPVADNGTLLGRAQNRRVELILNPSPGALAGR